MSLISKRLLDSSDHWEFYMIPSYIHTLGGVSLKQLINFPVLMTKIRQPEMEHKLTPAMKNALCNTTLTAAKLDIGDFRYAIRLFKNDKLIFEVAIDGTKSVANVNGKEGHVGSEMKVFCMFMEQLVKM